MVRLIARLNCNIFAPKRGVRGSRQAGGFGNSIYSTFHCVHLLAVHSTPLGRSLAPFGCLTFYTYMFTLHRIRSVLFLVAERSNMYPYQRLRIMMVRCIRKTATIANGKTKPQDTEEINSRRTYLQLSIHLAIYSVRNASLPVCCCKMRENSRFLLL